MFKRILVPTDFSLCAEAALHHALFLAERYRAEVHLLHVAPEAPGAAPTTAWPDPFTAPRPGMPAYSEHWHHLLLRREVVHHDDPVAAILTYARAHAVDLIVMGAHGDRGAGHFLSQGVGSAFLGHTAEQVIRHAPCPVFRVGMRSGRSPELVRRILVPVDLSALSLLALAYARDLALRYQARLDLLRVIEREPGASISTHDAAALEARARAEVVAALEQKKGPDGAARVHVVEGRPVREIRGFVKRHAIDLMVLGAHSDVGRGALGNVAEQVVRMVPCPVFTVRNVETDAERRARQRGVFPVPSVFL